MMSGMRGRWARLYWRLRLWRWQAGEAWRRWRQRRRLLALLMLLAGGAGWLFWQGEEAEGEIAGPATATDADTLVVGGRVVRLYGVDAPELRQTCRRQDGSPWPCGQMAAAALSLHLGGRPVLCRLSGNDRFGRALGRCWAEGEEINAWLVREGWAVAYTRYSWRYLPQQALAWWQGRGIWQGEFDTPEAWRRANPR